MAAVAPANAFKEGPRRALKPTSVLKKMVTTVAAMAVMPQAINPFAPASANPTNDARMVEMTIMAAQAHCTPAHDVTLTPLCNTATAAPVPNVAVTNAILPLANTARCVNEAIQYLDVVSFKNINSKLTLTGNSKILMTIISGTRTSSI